MLLLSSLSVKRSRHEAHTRIEALGLMLGEDVRLLDAC